MIAADASAEFFDALGDPSRLRIVIWLSGTGPSSTLTLAHAIPATRQAATKHLLVLESAGVVGSEKRGRERIWALRAESLAAAGRYLDILSQRWDRRVDRLRALVED